MDTPIGKFVLTENQQANFQTLNVPPFKGVCYKEGGDLVAVSDAEPTNEQKQQLTNAINALPDVLDISVVEGRFIPQLFAGTLSVMFTIDEVVELRSSFGILQGYAEFHTHDAFVKMKQYLDKLEIAGDLTANQKARIYTACQNQGINLNNY